MKTELTFIVEEAIEGGYTAHALDEGIVTEADTLAELREMVRDAVDCHFDKDQKPKTIHLHFVRDEVIAA
ncbi:MAG: 2-oxoisovalerate dehydrogenase [Candidatus Kapaibacterium sp.]|jgi:predicted RNase H-like HicB family nuclease